ncbi:hypothetical protein WISP_101706 [Willisornis vidua]|uniref:Uncharacterized protein n=1 Tax=Willisornis vidua TaxID=1566151 RepID=A0ABQ9CYB7_9PASS|nr:hypothetical protein WISP_101706 [Willisornis vidua]
MPTGSRMDLLLAKAEAIRNDSNTFVITNEIRCSPLVAIDDEAGVTGRCKELDQSSYMCAKKMGLEMLIQSLDQLRPQKDVNPDLDCGY